MILVISEPSRMRRPLLEALSREPHDIRLLAYDADHIAALWPGRVEPFTTTAIDTATIIDACRGCGTVIQLTVPTKRAPSGHDTQLDLIATQAIVDAVARTAVRRFVSVACESCERSSEETVEANRVIRTFSREWLIVEAKLVYGPNDPIIWPLLQMTRASVSVRLLPSGTHRLQPLWYRDLASMAVRSVNLSADATRRIVRVSGSETIAAQELHQEIAHLLERWGNRLPLPKGAENWGPQTLMLPDDRPHDSEAAANVRRVFGVRPTPLIDGLTRLIEEQIKRDTSDRVDDSNA